MAGGEGKRIHSLFPDIPKPLIPLCSPNGIKRPVLEWEILSLRDQGFKEFILTVGYKSELIKNYFQDGSHIGVSISYYTEEAPLGNAGALFKIREQLGSEPFFLLNADSLFDIDFNRFVAFHCEKKALVSLFTHPNSHPYDSSLIISNDNHSVKAWLAKEDTRGEWYKNRVNAGLQIMDPSVLDSLDIDVESIGSIGQDGKTIKIDLDRNILKPLCRTNKMFCYDSSEYCKDMGTPERYERVSMDFQRGIVQAKNLRNKQKAIFLDRDGTINKYIGFLRKPDEFELLPGVTEAIRRINNSGYLAIVITNQPVIARGEVSIPELQTIHDKMETLLGREGVYVDGLYYCPHHPDKGFEGEIKELKIECNCRKPKPGLILRASNDFNIDLAESWMIGDDDKDVIAGKAAGCKTIRIGTGNNNELVAEDLLDAINIILQ